jgi:hypothetical protein
MNSRDALVAQLTEAVERLAASAEVQVRYLDERGMAPSADELALELDDVWRAAAAKLTDPQRIAVERLDAALRELGGRDNETFWRVAALESDPRWDAVRNLAQEALTMLLESTTPCKVEPPEMMTDNEQARDPLRVIGVSKAQCDYILAADFARADLQADLATAARLFATTPPPRLVVVEIAHLQAEAFRAACTARLAEVGFDENYKLTDEGAMLEDLIDTFCNSAA